MNWESFFAACLGYLVGAFTVWFHDVLAARQRCYFCWRTANRSSTATDTHESGAPVWSVTRWACDRHYEDAMDLASGNVQRLTKTGPWATRKP